MREILFEMAPNSLNGVQVWGFCRSLPPVYVIMEELFSDTTSMFWVLVLLESTICVIIKCRLNKINGKSPTLRILTYRAAFIMSVKIMHLVAPYLDIPPQTYTFTGCLGLGLNFLASLLVMKNSTNRQR